MNNIAAAHLAEHNEARMAAQTRANERIMLDAIQARALITDICHAAFTDGRYTALVEIAKHAAQIMQREETA